MAWHIVEKLIEQVGQHSTLVGKFWTTFFFVLRFLIVVSIADDVFEDEQEEFVCNTLTPGCKNVCFNEFSPLSLIRLWAFQVLSVAIPSVIFIVYTAHKLTKVDQAKKLKKKEAAKKLKRKQEAKMLGQQAREKSWRQMTGSDPPEYNHINSANGEPSSFEPVVEKASQESSEKDQEKDDDNKEEVIATKLDKDTPSILFLAYVSQVIFRLAIEIGFIVAQMHMYTYKFYIPELYKCSKWPCPNVVDCFVSRPKEKTVLLWVMFGTGIIMIAVNVIELYHLGFGKIIDAWSRRHDDITKRYKVGSNSMPHFGKGNAGYARYRGGYPQAVGIRVGYARSSIAGSGGIHMDEFI